MKLKLVVFIFILLLICTMVYAQGPTKMYWTEYYPYSTHDASRANLDGSSPEELCTNYYGFEGIAVDFQNNKMYLAAPYQGKIERADLDGTNREDFITSIHPVDIALNLSAGKIYWTDYTYSNAVIKRANLDGSGVESITPHLGDGCDLQGMTIDVPGGKIYWVERMDDVICRANLDGTGIQTILHCYDGVSNSWDVAVYGTTLFWTDALLGTDNISKADLDGSNVVNDVVAGLNGPRCIAIDQALGKMYWVSSEDESIKRADVDGSNIETVVTGLSHPFGISLNYNQNTLPVELTEFTAVFSNDEHGTEYISVNWETASETDVLGFNIYRSEQNDISIVGNSINSDMILATGTTTQPQQYAFNDLSAITIRPYYYWLEVVNLDYTIGFHGPIQYTPGDTDGDNEEDLYLQSMLGDSYPNPVKNTTEITFQIRGAINSQNATLQIYNILGELVKTVQGTEGKASIDVTELSNGIYFYVLQTSSTYNVKRFVVFK
jgi:hypothetical protein